MKININNLREFMKKITLNGIIGGSVLIFNNNGIDIWVRDLTGAIAIYGSFNENNFTDYEKFENIGIQDNKIFLKMIKGFNNFADFKSENGKIIIKDDKKEIEIIQGNENYIDNKLNKELDLTYEKEVDIDSEIFKNGVKDMEDLESAHMDVMIVDNVLMIKVGEDGFNKIIEKENIEYSNIKSVFGIKIKEVIDLLNDKIKISFGNEYPITIKEENENWKIKYIIAPIQEEK